MDDADTDLFITRVNERFSVDELCEQLGLSTSDIVERFYDEIIDKGYAIFDD